MQAEAWSQVVCSYCNHHSAVFPGCLGDTQFCFRFRQGSNRKSSLGCFLETTDRDAPPCLKVRRHTQHQRPTYINVHYSKHVNHLVKTLFWLCVCVCCRGNRAITMVTCTSVRCETSPWREDTSRRSVTGCRSASTHQKHAKNHQWRIRQDS